MNVYVVWWRDVNDGSEIIKVFDGKEKADRFVEKDVAETNAMNEKEGRPDRLVKRSDHWHMQGYGFLEIKEQPLE